MAAAAAAGRTPTQVLPAELWQSIAACALVRHRYRACIGLFFASRAMRALTVHSEHFWRIFVFERYMLGAAAPPLYVPLLACVYTGLYHTSNSSTGMPAHIVQMYARNFAKQPSTEALGAHEAVRRTLVDWHVKQLYDWRALGEQPIPATFKMSLAALYTEPTGLVEYYDTAADFGGKLQLAQRAHLFVRIGKLADYGANSDVRIWVRVAVLSLFCAHTINAPIGPALCRTLLRALGFDGRDDDAALRWLVILNSGGEGKLPTWLGLALADAVGSLTFVPLPIEADDATRKPIATLQAGLEKIPINRRVGVMATLDSAVACYSNAANCNTEPFRQQRAACMRALLAAITYLVRTFGGRYLVSPISNLRQLVTTLAAHEPDALPPLLRHMRPFLSVPQRRALCKNVMDATMPRGFADKRRVLVELLVRNTGSALEKGVRNYALSDVPMPTLLNMLTAPGTGLDMLPVFRVHEYSALHLEQVREELRVRRVNATATLDSATRTLSGISSVLEPLEQMQALIAPPSAKRKKPKKPRKSAAAAVAPSRKRSVATTTTTVPRVPEGRGKRHALARMFVLDEEDDEEAAPAAAAAATESSDDDAQALDPQPDDYDQLLPTPMDEEGSF